ncbi:MAG: peptide ABC transporter substrate-binding protein [Deltaproteobacteria bacterium]|nr:peptide ABC transporter substrate-binding protein [Deltaproteobacteria bacterium]
MARKNRSKSTWLSALVLGIIVLTVIFVFTKQQKDKNASSQLIVGITQEPDTLNPLFQEMAASSEMYNLYFEDMVEFDLDWNIIPRLITELPTLKNGKVKHLSGNRIEVTWTLKPNLKWADGTALTPQDFIITEQMTMDERLPVISRDVAKRIEKMEAKDDRTLVVTWKEPYAYAAIGGHGALPKHVVEPLYLKDPAKFHESPFNANPVGNGPYVVSEWVSGSHLIFTKNPHWYGTPVSLEKIIYKVIPNTNSLESNLISGTIHAISPLGLSLDQALDFERRHGEKFAFHYRPALTWEHIDCNLDNPILKDKRVRQALMYSANRQMMVDVLFQGKQPVADSWLPPKHYGFNPKVKSYAYSPEKANQLLDEAGWVLTPSGIRVNNRGDKLHLTLMTTAGNKTREQVQQILQADWKKIGVELEIINEPAKVFFGETMRHRKFKHLALYAWVNSPLSDCEGLWTSYNIPSEKNNWQGQNQPGWINARSDEICKKIKNTLEEADRKDMLQEQQALWAEEVPSLPMFFRTDASVTQKGIENWQLTGNLQPVTWNAEEWKFKAE